MNINAIFGRPLCPVVVIAAMVSCVKLVVGVGLTLEVGGKVGVEVKLAPKLTAISAGKRERSSIFHLTTTGSATASVYGDTPTVILEL
jgi:hypothetical protein